MTSFAVRAEPQTIGLPISEARQSLLAAGWKPVETNLKYADGTLLRESGAAREFAKLGYIEIESCSGVGRNYCFFNYRNAQGCLRLMTQGERDPAVVRETHDCPPTSEQWKSSDANVSKR